MLTQVEISTILARMAIKTKSIKVSERAHQQLRALAAKYDARIWAIVDMAIIAFKVAEQAKNGKKSR